MRRSQYVSAQKPGTDGNGSATGGNPTRYRGHGLKGGSGMSAATPAAGQNLTTHQAQAPASQMTTEEFPWPCHYCKKPGHKMKDCPDRKANRSQRQGGDGGHGGQNISARTRSKGGGGNTVARGQPVATAAKAMRTESLSQGKQAAEIPAGYRQVTMVVPNTVADMWQTSATQGPAPMASVTPGPVTVVSQQQAPQAAPPIMQSVPKPQQPATTLRYPPPPEAEGGDIPSVTRCARL